MRPWSLPTAPSRPAWSIPADHPLIRKAATEIARSALYTEARPEHIVKAAAWGKNTLVRIAEGKTPLPGLESPRESMVVKQSAIDASGRAYTRTWLNNRNLP